MKQFVVFFVIMALFCTASADGLKIIGVKDIDANTAAVRLETEHKKGVFSNSADWEESIQIADLPAKYQDYMFFRKSNVKETGKLSVKDSFLTVDEFSYVVHLSKKWLESADGKVQFVLSITNDPMSAPEILPAPAFSAPYGTHQYFSSSDVFDIVWSAGAAKYKLIITEYNKGQIKYIVNTVLNKNHYALKMKDLDPSCEYIINVRQSNNGEIYSREGSKYFRTRYTQETYNKRCIWCNGTGHVTQYVPDPPTPPNNGHHTNPNHGHVNDKGYQTVICTHCHGMGYSVEYGNAFYYVDFR